MYHYYHIFVLLRLLTLLLEMANKNFYAYRMVSICAKDDNQTISYLSQVNEAAVWNIDENGILFDLDNVSRKEIYSLGSKPLLLLRLKVF